VTSLNNMTLTKVTYGKYSAKLTNSSFADGCLLNHFLMGGREKGFRNVGGIQFTR